MRFILLVKSDEKTEAGLLPSEDELVAIGKFNQELAREGALLGAEGLLASSRGTRVRISGTKTTFIDGPFADARALVAGYWLIQAKSREEAVEWAKRAPLGDGEVELRPLYEVDELPLDPAARSDGWREREERFREIAAITPPPRKPGTRRYAVFLKADRSTEAGMLPNEKLLTEMGALIEETAAAGDLLAGEGLQPTAKGARIRYSGKKRTVVDGPFTETKELIAGYSIVQAAVKAAAVEFARRCLAIHMAGTGVAEGEIEVRPIGELDDHGVEPPRPAA